MTLSTTSMIPVDRSLLEGPLEDLGPLEGADTGEPMMSGKVLQTVVLLQGRARLTDADGSSVELGPGDGIVLPKGWSGRWDILETLRKFYVIAD